MRIRTFIATLLLGSAALSLSACNTVRGIAADLDSAADAGEEAID